MKHVRTNLENDDIEIIAGISHISTMKEFHTHETAQLSYTLDGIMYIAIKEQLFIVPPGVAILIPPKTLHKQATIKNNMFIHCIYFPSKYFKFLPPMPCLINLSELARLLMAKICQLSEEELESKDGINLILVLLYEMKNSDFVDYSIRIPIDHRLFKVYNLFCNCDNQFPSIEEAARHANISDRSLTRLFKSDTGMSFILWKQKFIFIKSLELLDKFKNTNIVAYKLGYASDSAFISMFKKMSGGKLPSNFYNFKNSMTNKTRYKLIPRPN